MATERLEGRHILIVDDDEDILSSIELALRMEGATTASVTDGSAAVSMVHAQPFDAVVLDMMLPKRSGFLVLEKIMEYEEPPLVVMITANQGKRHQAYAESLGVAAYFVKPVPLQRLMDRLVELVQDLPLALENGDEPGEDEAS